MSNENGDIRFQPEHEMVDLYQFLPLVIPL